jgi:hypothetical protein
VDGIMLPCHLPKHRPLETFYDSVPGSVVKEQTDKFVTCPVNTPAPVFPTWAIGYHRQGSRDYK